MKIEFVDLKAQYKSIKGEIDEAIATTISNTDFINGAAVKTFAKKFAEYCNTQFCVPCANGTDAIELVLKAAGIKEGDEVIVPAMSFIATSEAVTAVGAKVVFVDVHPSTSNINPDLIEAKISPKTRAIICVHLCGQMCEMDKIMTIAEKYKLLVIEDSAQAHGAKYLGKKAGEWGNAATFSFYPGKNLGAYGDGGAITTNNDVLYNRAYMAANHGRLTKYDHEFEGRNSRLDTMQAAILNVKLKYIDHWNSRRRKNAELYKKNLAGIPEIILPETHQNAEPVFHLFVIKVQATKRAELQEFLKSKGIPTGVHYPIALPNLQAYNYLKHLPEDFPIAYAHSREALSLPMYPELKEEEIKFICEKIREYFKR